MKVKLEKSPDAFRTISEVSEELNLPNHVLRFWETKFPQLKPLKRSGGRRYYRPKDIDLLSKIKKLLYENGYTLKGAKRYLNQNNIVDEIKKDLIGSKESFEIKDNQAENLFSFNHSNNSNLSLSKMKIKEDLMEIISDIDKLIAKYN